MVIYLQTLRIIITLLSVRSRIKLIPINVGFCGITLKGLVALFAK